MVTVSSRPVGLLGRASTRRPDGRRRVIQHASAWQRAEDPQLSKLQDLEASSAIRWVDIYGGELRDSEALALLNPVCRGELKPRMVRDLVAAGRFPAGRTYEFGAVTITSAFKTRPLPDETGGAAAILEPVHLLVGGDWLITCWLPPRVYRGIGTAVDAQDQASDELHRAVATAWRESGGETASDLAELVRSALASTNGHSTSLS
jgi:hypothetical protein